MRNTVKVILIISVILLALYVRQYYAYPAARQVLQTSLSDFRFDQLLARQPLVIQDRVSGGLEEIAKLWFPNNAKQYYSTSKDTWIRAKHKYTLLYHPDEPMEVLVLHANGKVNSATNSPDSDETLTAINLEANQVLIIPFHTTYSVNNEKGIILAVHDWVTRFLP